MRLGGYRESVSKRRKLCVNPKTDGADATKRKKPAVLPRAGLELGSLRRCWSSLIEEEELAAVSVRFERYAQSDAGGASWVRWADTAPTWSAVFAVALANTVGLAAVLSLQLC